MPLVKRRFQVIASALIILVAACGVDESSADFPDAELKPDRSLESILALVPDTEMSRQHVLIDDLAVRRQLLGIPLPDTGPSEDGLDEYPQSMARFETTPITRDYGQLITGFPENGASYRQAKEIGFDLRNADQSIHIRGDRFRRMELVIGRYNPGLTDELIATCDNCVPVNQLSHEGTDYYSWTVGRQYGDFRLAPPITDHSGEGGFFWFTDSMSARSLHQVDMEQVIEHATSGTPSLLDDADYALAAASLGAVNRIDAIFSGKTLSLALAMSDVKETAEGDSYGMDFEDGFEEIIRGPGLLLPYSLHASSVRLNGDAFVVTNVLIHENEDAARANAERLRSRIEGGESARGERWTSLIDSYEVSVSGRAVIAEFRSDETDVTFVRVWPTDTTSQLLALYSTLFTHENAADSSGPDWRSTLPTPTPKADQSPPAEGKVGEQEPACLDRGGGGSYRDGFNRIYWFMRPPEPGTSDAQAVAQHLCIRGGDWVPDGRLIVRQADFLWSDLEKWRRLPVMWSVEGAYSNDVDETQNRIVVRVRTPYAGEQLKKNIQASESPIEAVIIEVDKQIGLDDPPVATAGESGIEISVEFDPEAEMGTDVEFHIVLTNRSDRSIEVEHGHPPGADIVVLTADGEQVWRHLGPIIAGVGWSTPLGPGETTRFSITWSQEDLDGFSVPPGEYLVRGFMRFVYYEDSYSKGESLSTGPVPLDLVE